MGKNTKDSNREKQSTGILMGMDGEPLVILLVEDNDDHATLVLRSLAEQRVANVMFRVDDGEKALQFLFHTGAYENKESSPLVNLILLDLRLPKIDGLEVLRVIKTTPALQRIPVVILSSSDAESDVARSYDHHANSYLVKPLDFETFTKLMEDLGFYWLAWNRQPGHYRT